MLFGNSEEDWSIESTPIKLFQHGYSLMTLLLALTEAVKADHGFNVESRAIHDLLDIMSDFDLPMRRSYLQFITGSPKLPIGGKLFYLVKR